MATLYYAEYVLIAQTWTRIPTPYFCTGQESESESVPESVSDNVNEPLDTHSHDLPALRRRQVTWSVSRMRSLLGVDEVIPDGYGTLAPLQQPAPLAQWNHLQKHSSLYFKLGMHFCRSQTKFGAR